MIRPAASADAPAMARIVADWIAATPWLADRPDAATLEAVIREALPRRAIWVAGDPVAGYLSMDQGTAWIHGFYVARPGGGTGKRLLDRAKAGRTTLALRSHAPNHAAHRFYAREGFRITDRDLPGTDGQTEIRMEWRA